MKIYDVSLPVSPDLPVWPGDPPIELARLASISEGSDANVSRLACGVHMGTHVDAPLHFIDGAETVDQFDLSTLIGRVHVVDLQGETTITAARLETVGITKRARRVLFKTDNSRLWEDGQSEPGEWMLLIRLSCERWQQNGWLSEGSSSWASIIFR